ncbi:MAG TPA: ATP-binding protein [Candidatus Eremiobacteraceae bacterium]
MTTSPRRRQPAANGRTISVRLPGTPSSVAEARDQIVGFARESGFPDDQLFDIGLAVGEACANAVMHAVAAQSTFQVEAIDRGREIVVTVTDPGDDTLPPLLRDPDRVGGLGLFLIRHLMDRMSLDMSAEGTRLTMSRRKPAA